jgi:hypothetical protein
VYIDAVLVFGKNLQEHDKNLELVLEKIKEYGLNENLQKRIDRVTEVKIFEVFA